MVFVVYVGNLEPKCLWSGNQRKTRQSNESWGDFKDRVQHTAPHEQFAVGDMTFSN